MSASGLECSPCWNTLGSGTGCTAGAVYVTAAMKRLWDKLCCKAAGPRAAAVVEVHQWRILTGRIFGKLTVLELAEWKNGTSYWHCRCECGNETIVRYVYLINGHTKSCGCLQSSIIKTNMKFVDGTSVTLLEKTGKRLLKNNSSGYNGVYLNRRTQKWTAQIGFKGKNYNLGSFSRIEDAVEARKKAEDRIYGEFLEWYYQTYQRKPVHTTNSSKTET